MSRAESNSQAQYSSSPYASGSSSCQALDAERRRRRRREAFVAVERRRRVNINQTIGELASLIPECMLEADDGIISSLLEGASHVDVLSSKRENSDVHADECDNVGDVARKVASANSGGVIGNKGIILRRSVEYIQYLQGLVRAQVARNHELEAELKVYRAASGVLSSSSIRSAGGHVLDLVSVTSGPPGQPQPHLLNNQDYRRLHQNSMQDISRTPELSVGDESGHRNHQSLTGHHRCNDDYCHTRHLSVSPSHAPYIPHPRPRPDNEYTHTAFTSHLHSSTTMSIVSSPSQSDSDSRPAAKTTMNPSKRRRTSTDSASEPSSSPASYGSLDNFSNKSSVTSNSVRSFMDHPFSSYFPCNGGNPSPSAQSNKPYNWTNSSGMTSAFSHWSDSRSPIATDKNWSRPGSAQSGSSGGRSDSP